MQVDDTRRDYALESLCFDIIVYDPDPLDSAFLQFSSPSFDLGAQYSIGTGTYTYFNDTTQQLNFVNISGTSFNTDYGLLQNVQTIGMRYCWDLQCEHLGTDYPIYLDAFSISYCGDTVRTTKQLNVSVDTIPNYLNTIPNVFTPNGDGMNEVFTVDGKYEPCFDFMDVKIFNRWGLLVFESTDPVFVWDGTYKGGQEAPSGTYFVLLEGQYATEPVSR
jgi:gliding motility-associated-like protein